MEEENSLSEYKGFQFMKSVSNSRLLRHGDISTSSFDTTAASPPQVTEELESMLTYMESDFTLHRLYVKVSLYK